MTDGRPTAGGHSQYDPVAHADEIAAFYRARPSLWEIPVERARQAREEGLSVFGPLAVSEIAHDSVIPGPDRPIRVRWFLPDRPAGLYIHIHGGGWMLGGAHHLDDRNEEMARACSLAVASIDYRLAPEHPYPAGPDDCEAAALWLIEHARRELHTERIFIGGESAGAHLSVVTMLRLRDHHDLTPFAAANLVYGAFDLRMTPSAATWGERPVVLSTPLIEFFAESFVGDADRTHPDISPLFADLAQLAPALFTVGTADPLLDDTLFMAARWRQAGNDAEIMTIEDAFHGFDYFSSPLGDAARQRMYAFLAAR